MKRRTILRALAVGAVAPVPLAAEQEWAQVCEEVMEKCRPERREFTHRPVWVMEQWNKHVVFVRRRETAHEELYGLGMRIRHGHGRVWLGIWEPECHPYAIPDTSAWDVRGMRLLLSHVPRRHRRYFYREFPDSEGLRKSTLPPGAPNFRLT